MSKAYRAGLPDMPERVKALPVSDKGYPIPFFVAYVDGKPDFRLADEDKMRQAVTGKRCWICGEVLGKFKSFVAGPMCGINRTSAEPPSHRECAEFAARACPFLILPRAQRREANMPEDKKDPAGIAILRNPGVVMVWTTDQYSIVRAGNGIVFQMGEPNSVEWYAEARAATRMEVLTSMNSGLPALMEIAQRDGPEAFEELRDLVTFAMQYIPAPDPSEAGLHYLNFVDPTRPDGEQFLGAALVEAADLSGAIAKTWALQINPGGQVSAAKFDPEQAERVPERYRDKLLTEQDLIEMDEEVRTQGA